MCQLSEAISRSNMPIGIHNAQLMPKGITSGEFTILGMLIKPHRDFLCVLAVFFTTKTHKVFLKETQRIIIQHQVFI